MKESYCIKDKRVTPCIEPSGYQTDKKWTKTVLLSLSCLWNKESAVCEK